VKRSGRDELMWVAIQKYMEAKLVIFLYSNFYLRLQKCYEFLIISYVFSSKLENKRVEQVLSRSGGWRCKCGVVAQIMYVHVSKCKNDF
jgi:hypothetical protein